VPSQIAFAHAMVVLAGALSGTNNFLPIPTSGVGCFYRDDLSTVFVCEKTIASATSPVTWLLNYVVTGAPRILPWQKMTRLPITKEPKR